jgi:hypothetical protein
MRILFISSGMWEYDGRLRELVKVAAQLGDVKVVTRARDSSSKQGVNHVPIVSENYGYFILKTIIEGLKWREFNILFIDNRRAIIPGLIIWALRKPLSIVLDVRELYLLTEVRHLSGKIGCFLERIMIKRADVVISANKYRAEFMKTYHQLERLPLVFENIRNLDYDDQSIKRFEAKYRHIFSSSAIKIISTSGCSLSRTNDRLVEAICQLGNGYELLLVGGGSERERALLEGIVRKNKMRNVHFIGLVEADELRFLISNCDMGIVNYHQKDLNNKYCASGKLYEFVFAGLPVVTTENVPLVEICRTYHIGEPDNEYIDGIRKVHAHYGSYKENVTRYRETLDVEQNNVELANAIVRFLNH